MLPSHFALTPHFPKDFSLFPRANTVRIHRPGSHRSVDSDLPEAARLRRLASRCSPSSAPHVPATHRAAPTPPYSPGFEIGSPSGGVLDRFEEALAHRRRQSEPSEMTSADRPSPGSARTFVPRATASPETTGDRQEQCPLPKPCRHARSTRGEPLLRANTGSQSGQPVRPIAQHQQFLHHRPSFSDAPKPASAKP